MKKILKALLILILAVVVLAGAGLGGCMMIFTHREAIPELTAALMRDYYEKFDRPARILPCRPVSGAGALVVETG